MAKKKSRSIVSTQGNGEANSAQEVNDGRVSFLLRLDKDLHELLKTRAEEAGISLNQLIQGLCRGTSQYLQAGEWSRDSTGTVRLNRDVKRCLGVGKPGWYMSWEQRQDFDPIRECGDPDAEPGPNDPGFLWFGLDFTDRGVVNHSQK